jgi:hypothetical protein
MPITYEPIATTTLGTAAASVTFSTISGAYTDLVLVLQTSSSHSASNAVIMQFNNDTGSNYSLTRIIGDGSSATSDRFSSVTSIDAGFLPANNGTGNGTIIANIMNYSNATTYKTVLGRWESMNAASGSRYTVAEVGLWRNTSAITEIDLKFVTGNLVAGSTFTLYGIKAA